jgi:hypothetical protein
MKYLLLIAIIFFAGCKNKKQTGDFIINTTGVDTPFKFLPDNRSLSLPTVILFGLDVFIFREPDTIVYPYQTQPTPEN